MSQPVAYTPAHEFLTDEGATPAFPGSEIDIELARIKTTTDQIRTNIALIQRDDGALKNSVVTYDSLSPTLQTAGLSPLTAWSTATRYDVPQVVINGTGVYQCAVGHTSGTFATDLAAGNWTLLTNLSLFADSAATTSANFVAAGPTSGGDGAITFRALVSADIPTTLTSTINFTNATNPAIFNGGTTSFLNGTATDAFTVWTVGATQGAMLYGAYGSSGSPKSAAVDTNTIHFESYFIGVVNKNYKTLDVSIEAPSGTDGGITAGSFTATASTAWNFGVSGTILALFSQGTSSRGGNIYGGNSVATATTIAPGQVIGWEFNTDVRVNGASNKIGKQTVDLSTSIGTGVTNAFADYYINQAGAYGWDVIFQIGLTGASATQFPLRDNGWIMRVQKGADTPSINGIDLSDVSIATSAFKSPGFNVGAGGAVTALTGSFRPNASAVAVDILSDAANRFTAYQLGRTAAEGTLGVAGNANDFVTGSAAGDIMLMSAGGNLLLGSNNLQGIKIDKTLATLTFPQCGAGILHSSAGGEITSSAVSLTADVSGILGSVNGGTGNGFTKFAGPTTSEKTFTLPDADATLLYSGGALGSPSSADTMPAFTLGGAISGGGNQINNIVIGASTPLAGSFTTVSASTVINSTVAPSATSTSFDASGQSPLSIGNGANADVVAAGAGLLMTVESTTSGDVAIWTINGGATPQLISSTGSTWVASTTTPGAGNASVAYPGAGSAIRIYNNIGTAKNFKASLYRVN